jgi:hypothetical protein
MDLYVWLAGRGGVRAMGSVKAMRREGLFPICFVSWSHMAGVDIYLEVLVLAVGDLGGGV